MCRQDTRCRRRRSRTRVARGVPAAKPGGVHVSTRTSPVTSGAVGEPDVDAVPLKPQAGLPAVVVAPTFVKTLPDSPDGELGVDAVAHDDRGAAIVVGHRNDLAPTKPWPGGKRSSRQRGSDASSTHLKETKAKRLGGAAAAKARSTRPGGELETRDVVSDEGLVWKPILGEDSHENHVPRPAGQHCAAASSSSESVRAAAGPAATPGRDRGDLQQPRRRDPRGEEDRARPRRRDARRDLPPCGGAHERGAREARGQPAGQGRRRGGRGARRRSWGTRATTPSPRSASGCSTAATITTRPARRRASSTRGS